MPFIIKNCVAVAVAGGNSLGIQTPTGRSLATPFKELQTKAMAEYSRLPKSERRPTEVPKPDVKRVVHEPPAETLVSRVYIRTFDRDRQGRLHRSELQSRKKSGPQRDFLWLTGPEWKSLVPERPTVGDHFPLPDILTRRLACSYLYDNTAGFVRKFKPDQIRSANLNLEVLSVSSEGVQMRLTGATRVADDDDRSQATHWAEFRLLGFLNYDAQKKAFDRFDIVALGDSYESRLKAGQQSSVTLGLAFELAAPESLGYGTPPGAIRNGSREQFIGYFGTDRDEGIRRYFQKD